MPNQDVSSARYYADLPDPQIDRTKKHTLGDIVVIVVASPLHDALGEVILADNNRGRSGTARGDRGSFRW